MASHWSLKKRSLFCLKIDQKNRPCDFCDLLVGGSVVIMDENKAAYVKRYLNISGEEMFDNSELLLDTLFYRKQVAIQHSPGRKNDRAFMSYARIFDFDSRQVRTPICKILSCRPPCTFRYPGGKTFAICLTHDVDEIYPTWIHNLLAAAYGFSRFDFQSIKRYLLWRYRGKNSSPFFNFRDIMELEAKHGAKSTFFFLTSGSDHIRFRYNVEDIESTISDIADSGWEIGLHGGYYTYNSYRMIQQEKIKLEEVLGKQILGYRNHYLRFQVPDTWELLAQAGFKYDTTFGFNDEVGFRNGLCHPFRPFNPARDQEIDILELPLNIMDCALMELAASEKKAWEIALELIDTAAEHHGVLTLLWHNNSFHYPPRRGCQNLYEKILEYGAQKNAWMTSGEEIWRWWNSGSCFNSGSNNLGPIY